MKKLAYILISISILLNNCKHDDDYVDPSEKIIAKEAKIISNDIWSKNLISLDSSNYTIKLSKEVLSSTPLKVSDIIVSSIGEGLLRKVTSIQNINNEIILKTEAASITDVVKQGQIEINQALTVQQINSITYHYSGIELNHPSSLKNGNNNQFEWNINTVLYDVDKDLNTTADQIRVKGNFSCDWTFLAKMDIGLKEGIKELKIGYIATENSNLELIAGLQYDFEKKYTLATLNFTPIVVTVGAVPVLFTPQLKIIIGISGYANSSISTGINQSLSFDAGLRYLKNSGWEPYKNMNKNFTANSPKLNINTGAELYIKPELAVKVYSIAGPYANLKLYSKLEADILQDPWWKLKGGITMGAGIKAELFDKFLLDFSVSDLLNYEQVISQANGIKNKAPNNPEITSPKDKATNVSISPTLTWTCSDPESDPIKYDVFFDETDILTNRIGMDLSNPSFTINNLKNGTQYYWKVIAKDNQGNTTIGNVWSFTTLMMTKPALTTTLVTNQTQTTATVGGNVTSDGGVTVTERGVYWGTSSTPETNGTKLQIGSGTGTFSSSLTGLNPNTTYYVKAYALNSQGTSYGDLIMFTTTQANSIPTVTTNSVTNQTQTTATVGGNVTSDGGASVTEHGVYWGTSSTPETNGTKLQIGSGTGTFSSSLTGLNPNTTYYVEAYAINSQGTSYGEQVSFKTLLQGDIGNSIVFNPNLTYGSVTDIDGNIYKTIQIGTQTWMAQNLATTTYNDGTPIPNITSNSSWATQTSSAYCWFNNSAPTYKASYGAIYNWYTVSSGKLCPIDWHVPTDAEWSILINYLGGVNSASIALKEIGTTHWGGLNSNAKNTSGFTAIPSGNRSVDGVFRGNGTYVDWWSATESSTTKALDRLLNYNTEVVYSGPTNKEYGFSIRCLKD